VESRVNVCPTCGEDFGSVSAFDAHRVGKYPQHGPSEYTGALADWAPEKGRRCLTVKELTERGWTRDGRERWRRPSQGAPWASSEDQVMTQRRRQSPAKGLSRRQRRDRSTRLPDPRSAPRQK
jgi:hypothetical protein